MLTCASAYTYELDDPKAACDEIKAQLAGLTLLPNTVGVVLCNPEFIGSGVLGHICASLPFEVVGITNAAQAVNGECGEAMLTLFVMTSDDSFFRVGVTENVAGGIDEVTRAAWETAAAGTSAPAKLALIFPPFLTGASGDDFVRAWEKILPGTPVFGTVAVDDSIAFTDCRTIYRGQSYKSSIAFILCYGAIQPRFWLAGITPGNQTIPKKGTVTRASGVCVHEIDGIPTDAYLKGHELTRNLQSAENYRLTPFMVELTSRPDNDGVPVTKALIDITPDGAAIFLGDVDEGSSITPLRCTHGDLVAGAARAAKALNAMPGVHGALLFSCAVRRIVLMAGDAFGELNALRDGIRPDIPFMAGCSGGEICPTSIRDGVPVNRYHCYSIVMLAV